MHSIPITGKPIYWIRHAETSYNKNEIVQGSGINAPISETGKVQATAFFQAYRNIPFSAIFTSKLKRTKQTIELFAKNENIPVYELEELNEIFWGNWEGKPVNSLKNEIEKCYNEWKKGNINYNPYNGETPIQVKSRVKKAINTIINTDGEKPVLVCSHSRLSRIAFTTFFGYELNYMYLFNLKNTALNIITYHKDYFILHKFNDITHLLLCESL